MNEIFLNQRVLKNCRLTAQDVANAYYAYEDKLFTWKGFKQIEKAWRRSIK